MCKAGKRGQSGDLFRGCCRTEMGGRKPVEDDDPQPALFSSNSLLMQNC